MFHATCSHLLALLLTTCRVSLQYGSYTKWSDYFFPQYMTSSSTTSTECPICCNFLPRLVMFDQCLHKVCEGCVLQWIQREPNQPCCPFCRTPFSSYLYETKTLLPALQQSKISRCIATTTTTFAELGSQQNPIEIVE